MRPEAIVAGNSGDEVAAAQVDRIQLELGRERVDGPLDRVRRLRPAGAAVGVGRRRVREDARALEAVRGNVVAARVHQAPSSGMPGVTSCRYAPIAETSRTRTPVIVPVLGRGQLDLLDDVAAVDGRAERLRALLDPLDRPVQPPREREAERLLGVDVELGAEAAAHVGGDHAQPRLRDADDTREGEPRCAGSASTSTA